MVIFTPRVIESFASAESTDPPGESSSKSLTVLHKQSSAYAQRVTVQGRTSHYGAFFCDVFLYGRVDLFSICSGVDVFKRPRAASPTEKARSTETAGAVFSSRVVEGGSHQRCVAVAC